MASAFLVSLSTWNALERAVDRWASLGALALAAAAVLLFAIFH